MNLINKLNKIQNELKAPKNQRNNFGNYNYRSCEDILEAVKPLLPEDTTVFIKDEIVEVAGRIYVKATAILRSGEEVIEGVAFAREPEIKKGMDESQITGAASSYARKYALNGLFLIDDTKDADHYDNREQTASKPAARPQTSHATAMQTARQQVKVESSLITLKKKLQDAGAKDELKALEILEKSTGVRFESIAEVKEETAKELLGLWTFNKTE